MTVEIDESKFGKLKFNRGRRIEGQWVFGGICRQTKAYFLVPVGQRDKDYTPTHHSSSHISRYIRDERHVEGLRLHKRRGLHSSHSQPQPKLRRPRHRCATHSALKICGGESNEVCLVLEHPKISSKATYRNGYGVSTMETNLLKT